MSVQSYRDLTVWQRAMELIAACYELTRSLPKPEQYCLTSQLKRAAISVAANIAEGHGRLHLGEYVHHLSVARGSLMELETHLLVAERLKFIGKSQSQRALELSGEVSRMLAVLLRRLRHRGPQPSP